MKKTLLLVSFLLIISCRDSEPNACIMSKDFIKEDLKFPNEAEFSSLDCNVQKEGSDLYTVLRKVEAKNAFGVKQSYIYKVTLKFKGGITVDKNNWEVIAMRSEEYKN